VASINTSNFLLLLFSCVIYYHILVRVYHREWMLLTFNVCLYLCHSTRQTAILWPAFCTTWISCQQKGKNILMKQEMIGWQWHQLDHTQITCTWLRRYRMHAWSSLLNFYRWDALPDIQPTVSEHWRQYITWNQKLKKSGMIEQAVESE